MHLYIYSEEFLKSSGDIYLLYYLDILYYRKNSYSTMKESTLN